jgi:hypothetical protein
MREFALISQQAAALDVMEAQLLLLSLVPFLNGDEGSDDRGNFLLQRMISSDVRSCMTNISHKAMSLASDHYARESSSAKPELQSVNRLRSSLSSKYKQRDEREINELERGSFQESAGARVSKCATESTHLSLPFTALF